MKLRGEGLTALTSVAKTTFEIVTEDLYRNIYRPAITSPRRFLQDFELDSFDTDVRVTDDTVDDTGITIIYDQSLSFTGDRDSLNQLVGRDVLLDPLSDDDEKREYLQALQDGDEAYYGSVTAVDSPSLPEDSSRSTNDDDSGGITRIVLIVIVVLGSILCCACVLMGVVWAFILNEDAGKQRARRDDRVDESERDDTNNNGNYFEDDFGPPKEIGAEQGDPLVDEEGLGRNSMVGRNEDIYFLGHTAGNIENEPERFEDDGGGGEDPRNDGFGDGDGLFGGEGGGESSGDGSSGDSSSGDDDDDDSGSGSGSSGSSSDPPKKDEDSSANTDDVFP